MLLETPIPRRVIWQIICWTLETTMAIRKKIEHSRNTPMKFIRHIANVGHQMNRCANILVGWYENLNNSQKRLFHFDNLIQLHKTINKHPLENLRVVEYLVLHTLAIAFHPRIITHDPRISWPCSSGPNPDNASGRNQSWANAEDLGNCVRRDRLPNYADLDGDTTSRNQFQIITTHPA